MAAPEPAKTNGDLIKIPDDVGVPDPRIPAEPKKEPEANKLLTPASTRRRANRARCPNGLRP